jgi:hypothetical protein
LQYSKIEFQKKEKKKCQNFINIFLQAWNVRLGGLDTLKDKKKDKKTEKQEDKKTKKHKE